MVRTVCRDHSYTMSKLGRMSFSDHGTRQYIEGELRKAFSEMTDEDREKLMTEHRDRCLAVGVSNAAELLDYELGLLRGISNEVEFVDWAKETIFYRDEPWQMSVQDYCGDLRAFCKNVLPRLGAMIAEEMAAELKAAAAN